MTGFRIFLHCFVALLIIQTNTAIGANSEQEVTDKKVLSIFNKLDKNLSKLEGFVDTAIPAVPLKSAQSKQSKSIFKGVESDLKKLSKSYPDIDASNYRNRFTSLKSFLENKENEPTSPAAKDIENMMMHVLYLEMDPDKRSESASRNFYTETFKASTKLAEAQEKDPDYDFSVLIERFAPHAQKFVEDSGRLLPHLSGYAEYMRADELQSKADAYVLAGAALSYKAELDKMVVEIDKNLALSKEKGPKYFKPSKAEAQLDFTKQVLVAAARNELKEFDKIDTQCQTENIGKVVFANKKLEDNCESSSFIESYEVGQPLYLRAAFEDIASNAYVKMRNHERTPGVHGGIEQKIVFSLDGKEVFTFIPFLVSEEMDRPATSSVLMDTTRLDHKEFFRHFDKVLLEMASTGKDKANFGIEVYAYNSTKQPGVPNDGPLLAKGEILIDASSDAAKKFMREGKLAISSPGELDDSLHDMAVAALERNKVEYDLFHITSDQMTIVKNVLDIPLKRVVRGIIVSKSDDNRCTAYPQWFAQVFDGTGYTKGVSLDKREHSKGVSCSSVEQYL
ncbi:hypothetical protein KQ940_09675 [Marinobacterium sp. D7]|uniref:hypothetical protein n=1 Tax=Marinobacterium ramblicola TaxID=2849041 RepID=UPI001C2CE63D|nr:hypothetical protein [Marinobacterium ramblicola]MBV1788324.1 hypothetical protein [Marinobacterium ramblicola]